MRLNYATRFLGLIWFSIAILPAADNPGSFPPKAASEYPNAQKTGGLIIAAEAYVTDEQTKAPFGKLNPNKHGVLPVLVIMENRSETALRLENMSVKYVTPDRDNIDAVKAADVPYLNSPDRPRMTPSPIPGLGRSKKNPLAAIEIESRAFAARILPPGEKAHGFVYFHLSHRRGAQLYLTGIEEAASRKELFFVEVPLGPAK